MGSPEVAVPFLEIINKQEEIIGVVTQEDRPAGRGYKLVSPPVKKSALLLNLPVYQPERIKNNQEFLELVNNFALDLIIVIAFGKILPIEILNAPKIGAINIHFSLLPKYRGPAPIQWAIINGEKETGVTIFWMNEQIDTGDMILQQKINIALDDNYITVLKKLTSVGISALRETLSLIKEKKCPRLPQINTKSSYAPILRKDNGKIQWNNSNIEIHNLTRALILWPGVYTKYKTQTGDYKVLKILETKILTPDRYASAYQGKPGEIIEIIKNEGIVVQCGEGYLLVKQVKLESGKAMSSYEFLQGHKIKIGEVLE